MASSFAAQLKQHTAGTTSDLDLKAQKVAHSKSLIFEEKIATSQDFDTLYQLCLEGFEDLCNIDPRFIAFQNSLFSNESRSTDRTRMTVDQNESLDVGLESFIGLVGPRLLLSPAVKALEWLVRRFRIHEHNTVFVIFTFLPYHHSSIFRSLLSILPSVPPIFNWLAPYQGTFSNPPRTALVQAAINSSGFFEGFNQYSIHLCSNGRQSRELLSFWTGITSEAISARLTNVRPGQNARDRQHEEFLVTFLPTIAKGLAMSDVSDLKIACYTFIIIMVKEGALPDAARNPLLIDVTGSLREDCLEPGLICLSRLLPKSLHSHYSLPSKVFRRLMRIQDLANRLRGLHEDFHIASLAYAVVTNILHGKKQDRIVTFIGLVEEILFADILDPVQVSGTFAAFFKALGRVDQAGQFLEQTTVITRLIKKLFSDGDLRNKLQTAAGAAGFDLTSLNLGSNEPQLRLDDIREEVDTSMEVDEMAIDGFSCVEVALSTVRRDYHKSSNLLDHTTQSLQSPLASAFHLACRNGTGIEAFLELPCWEDENSNQKSLLNSFLLAFACGPYHLQTRLDAASALEDWLNQVAGWDTQAVLPFVICLLADPIQVVRRAGAKILLAMASNFPSNARDGVEFRAWDTQGLVLQNDSQRPSKVPTKQVHKMLMRVFAPAIEDCVLDPDQIGRVLRSTLKPRKASSAAGRSQETNHLKKYLREGLFMILLDHISITAIAGLQITLLGLVQGIDSVGDVVKSQKLGFLLPRWAGLEQAELGKLQLPAHLNEVAGENAFCSILALSDDQAVNGVLESAARASIKRPEFGTALTHRVQQLWPTLGMKAQLKVISALLTQGTVDDAKNSTPNYFGEKTIRSLDIQTDVMEHTLETLLDSLKSALESRNSTQSGKPSKDTGQSPTGLSRIAQIRLRQLIAIAESVTKSTASDRVQLVPQLFQILVTLQQAEARHQTDLSYFLSLVLDALRSVVDGEASHRLKSDSAFFNLDAVIDCMRDYGHHAVHQSALSLLASLAEVFPERVLASVMPIFTFMSTKMHKNDEYSNDLVDQTMDRVLYSLLDPSDPPDSSPEATNHCVVLGFVTAFEHIPPEKRTQIFQKLLMGLQDARWFLQLTQQLMGRLNDEKVVQDFVTTLFDKYEISDQLDIASDFVKLIRAQRDILKLSNAPKSRPIHEKQAFEEKAVSLLSTLNILLKRDVFVQNASTIGEPQMMTVDPQTTLSSFKNLFVEMIELEQSSDNRDVRKRAMELLIQLRSVVPRYSLIQITQNVLCAGTHTHGVKLVVIKLVPMALQRPRRLAVLSAAFGSALTIGLRIADLIPEEDDEPLKQAMIVWVGEMCSLFGKADIDQVVRVAQLLASGGCLSPGKDSTSTFALLTLASLTDILMEGIIAIIPVIRETLTKVLPVDTEPDEALFRAAMAFLSNLIRHAVFALSEPDVEYILRLCALGKKWCREEESQKMTRQTMREIAMHYPLNELLVALNHAWPAFLDSGIDAARAAIDMVENAVQISAKHSIVSAVDNLFPLVSTVLDLRRQQCSRSNEDFSQAHITEVEDKTYGILIKAIMSLNSNVFNPHFTALITWAIKCRDIEPASRPKAQVLRQTTLFRFMTLFLDTLMSLVTNYALQIVDPAVAVLKAATEKPQTLLDPDQKRLYSSALTALKTAFLHDQHSHFSNPTYFELITDSLVPQLTIVLPAARNEPSVQTHVVPAIVTFAHAIRSTSSHLKALNSALFPLRRHELAAVRLAGVKAHLVLAGASYSPGAVDTTVRKPAEARGLDLDQIEALAEEWCTTALGVGQGMVYINEMLEDDDDEIEREVRRLARRVRVVMGEEGEGMLE